MGEAAGLRTSNSCPCSRRIATRRCLSFRHSSTGEYCFLPTTGSTTWHYCLYVECYCTIGLSEPSYPVYRSSKDTNPHEDIPSLCYNKQNYYVKPLPCVQMITTGRFCSMAFLPALTRRSTFCGQRSCRNSLIRSKRVDFGNLSTLSYGFGRCLTFKITALLGASGPRRYFRVAVRRPAVWIITAIFSHKHLFFFSMFAVNQSARSRGVLAARYKGEDGHGSVDP